MGLLCNIVIFGTISFAWQLQPVLGIEVHTDLILNQLSGVNITLNRTAIDPLYETRYLTTEFNLTGTIPDDCSLTIKIDDETYAIVSENATLQLPSNVQLFKGAFRMEGKRLGLGLLSFYLHPTVQGPTGENSTLLLSGIEVVVLRRP